jgi:hypothetical protein
MTTLASLDLKLLLDFLNFFSKCISDKLCMSTNFIILGATNQKLWVFENIKRSLGRAGSAGASEEESTTCGKKWGHEEGKGRDNFTKKGARATIGGQLLVANWQATRGHRPVVRGLRLAGDQRLLVGHSL